MFEHAIYLPMHSQASWPDIHLSYSVMRDWCVLCNMNSLNCLLIWIYNCGGLDSAGQLRAANFCNVL